MTETGRKICLGFALAVLVSMAQRADGNPHPNILLVMCDDLGWGDVGFNGNPTIRTPHLDAMANSGMTFNRFYAASPVCSPTRGSVLTGRHPSRYGIDHANSGHLPLAELTIAELLQPIGYATGHFGKWHLGTLTTTQRDSNRGGPRGAAHFSPPQRHGYRFCFATEAKVPTWDPLISPLKPTNNKWWDPVTDVALQKPYGTAYWNEQGKRVTENVAGDDSRIVMDRVVQFVRQAVEDGQPFFATVWFHAPHLPVVTSATYREHYAAQDKYAQHYQGCVTAMDEQIGRLRATLRKLEVHQNTLVAFCSDNGPEGRPRRRAEQYLPNTAGSDDIGGGPGSAGPFRGRKRDLFEGGIRVPSVIEWPARIESGTETNFPAVTSDYLPTIVDILDIESPLDRPLDGVSLLPTLRGAKSERPTPIGFDFQGKVALSGNRYKLIRYPRKAREGNERQRSSDSSDYMLFDLISDRAETTNVADSEPEIFSEMKHQLESWQRSCSRSRRGDDYRE